ncbi:MAG: signal peptidase I [Pseudomonadota bacterium]
MTGKPKNKSETPSWWRGRRLISEGRSFSREVRRTLRKLRGELSEAVVERAGKAVLTFEELRTAQDRDWRAIAAAISELGRLLEGELAAARKGVLRQYAESIAWAALIALVIRFFLLEPFQIPTGSMIPSLLVEDHIFVLKCTYGIQVPFLNSYVARWGQPERGDVIVFPFPVKEKPGCREAPGGENRDCAHPDYQKDFIKRVVGLPGDRMSLRNNRILVNGEPIDAEVLDEPEKCDIKDGLGRSIHCVCDRQRETMGDNVFVSRHIRALAGDLGCINQPDWPFDSDGYEVPEGHVFCMGDNRDNSSDGRYWGSVPIDTIKGKALFIWYATDTSRIFSEVP